LALTTEGKPLPPYVLLLFAGGVLAVVGSFLPWVSIGALLSVTGVEARWGLFTLGAGFAASAIAIQLSSGRLVRRKMDRALAIAAVVLGVVSLGIAIYVGFAVRDAVAESNSESSTSAEASSTGDPEFDASLDDFAKGIEEAFKVRTGAGVYLTVLSGILISAGGAIALMQIVQPPPTTEPDSFTSAEAAPVEQVDRRELAVVRFIRDNLAKKRTIAILSALSLVILLGGVSAGAYFWHDDPPAKPKPTVWTAKQAQQHYLGLIAPANEAIEVLNGYSGAEGLIAYNEACRTAADAVYEMISELRSGQWPTGVRGPANDLAKAAAESQTHFAACASAEYMVTVAESVSQAASALSGGAVLMRSALGLPAPEIEKKEAAVVPVQPAPAPRQVARAPIKADDDDDEDDDEDDDDEPEVGSDDYIKNEAEKFNDDPDEYDNDDDDCDWQCQYDIHDYGDD